MGMQLTKQSPSHVYEQHHDFGMVTQLLKNQLYNIPPQLRDKIICSAAVALDSPESSTTDRLAAARLLLEADRRNLELFKLSIPQKHIHFNVSEASTQELLERLDEAHKEFLDGSEPSNF